MKINKAKLKKAFNWTFVSSLTVCTIGFTMFGLGAGGKGTGVGQIAKIEDSQVTVKDDVNTVIDTVNKELMKLPKNSGFLKLQGKHITDEQKTALDTIKAQIATIEGDAAKKDNVYYVDTIKKIQMQIKPFNDIEKFNKSVSDNKLFFNIGVSLFSISSLVLIGCLAYYIYYKKTYADKE